MLAAALEISKLAKLEVDANGMTPDYYELKDTMNTSVAWAQVHATLACVPDPISFDDLLGDK